MTRPEFVHQRIAEAAAAAARARDARRAAELRTGASPAPASVRNALEDAREKAAQKARERDAVPGAVVHNAPITTHKPLFGYFHQDGTFATGVRKGITGHRHGHIGNHLRTTRKNWFGFGGRRRRSRRRKQRGGCGAGLCMSGGRRRRRKRDVGYVRSARHVGVAKSARHVGVSAMVVFWKNVHIVSFLRIPFHAQHRN